jgi:hypothetical protein
MLITVICCVRSSQPNRRRLPLESLPCACCYQVPVQRQYRRMRAIGSASFHLPVLTSSTSLILCLILPGTGTKAISSDESDWLSLISSTGTYIIIIYVINKHQYNWHTSSPVEIDDDTVSCCLRPHFHYDM